MAKLPVILTAVQTTFGHMHYHFFFPSERPPPYSSDLLDSYFDQLKVIASQLQQSIQSEGPFESWFLHTYAETEITWRNTEEAAWQRLGAEAGR